MEAITGVQQENYWHHFNMEHQTERANRGQFDAFYITSQSIHESRGSLVDEKYGNIYCGNFFANVVYQYRLSTGEITVEFNTKFAEVFITKLPQNIIKDLCIDSSAIVKKAYAHGDRCARCKKSYKTQAGLDKHINRNECKAKLFECNCGSWYSSMLMYRRHQKKTQSNQCFFAGSDRTYTPIIYLPDEPIMGHNWNQIPHECGVVGLHKYQLTVKPKDRNILNTIVYNCACLRKYYNEVSFKKHLLKCSQRSNAKLQARISQYDQTAESRRIMLFRDSHLARLQEQPELMSYLFENGPRPTRILGDVRMLGFRYIGERMRVMDISKFLAPVQIEREQKFGQRVYGVSHSNSAKFY